MELAYPQHMALFLVVYDRSRAHTVDLVRYEASQRRSALQARNDRELQELENPEIEVVILEADSEDDLRRTHARYFDLAEEIATREL